MFGLNHGFQLVFGEGMRLPCAYPVYCKCYMSISSCIFILTPLTVPVSLL